MIFYIYLKFLDLSFKNIQKNVILGDLLGNYAFKYRNNYPYVMQNNRKYYFEQLLFLSFFISTNSGGF